MKLQPTKVYRPCKTNEVEDAIATIDVGISQMEVPVKVENDKYLLSKGELRNKKQKTLLAFIKWSDARDEQGNKLDSNDIENFLNQNQ